ncbi:hypothetical protein WG66_006261 [Moniliophthora roreri]|nr:hypothetical protein WG66_006261 [Moniliophthora roreri]
MARKTGINTEHCFYPLGSFDPMASKGFGAGSSWKSLRGLDFAMLRNGPLFSVTGFGIQSSTCGNNEHYHCCQSGKPSKVLPLVPPGNKVYTTNGAVEC